MALQRPCQTRGQKLIPKPTEGWPYLGGGWGCLATARPGAGGSVARWHHCERRRQEHENSAAYVPAFPTLSSVRKLHRQYLTWPVLEQTHRQADMRPHTKTGTQGTAES